LPPEQQAEVDRIIAALDPETRAVTVANSNLVVSTFGLPLAREKIAKANEELAKARTAWAAKASKLFVENQSSEKKLSSDAINRLIQISSGRSGRGGPPGFGFGGPGGPGRGNPQRGVNSPRQ
jgi:hypothetical protein